MVNTKALLAQANYGSEELALELAYVMESSNQNDPGFNKKLANLYSFAILKNNINLMNFLENRFSNLKIADREIVINIV